jgi:hypothetical protein
MITPITSSAAAAAAAAAKTVCPEETLLQFIKCESHAESPHSNRLIIETYATTLWKGFFDMKHTLRNVRELNCSNAVDMGLLLIDNIFWIIYNYSCNIELTVFLTERGRLLYTEFLQMSRTHQLMNEINVFPTILDGFQFAIKKSIGTLVCNDTPTKWLFDTIASYRQVYRQMFQTLNRHYLVHPTDDRWTDVAVNATIDRLNAKMSAAVHRDHELFESCSVYRRHDAHPTTAPATHPTTHTATHTATHTHTATTVTHHLLFLQLLSDTSERNHLHHNAAVSVSLQEHVVASIGTFMRANEHGVATGLDCLHESHPLQFKWRVFLEQTVLPLPP